MAVLGAVAFFVYKKLKNKEVEKTKGESKEDEENKKEEIQKMNSQIPNQQKKKFMLEIIILMKFNVNTAVLNLNLIWN